MSSFGIGPSNPLQRTTSLPVLPSTQQEITPTPTLTKSPSQVFDRSSLNSTPSIPPLPTQEKLGQQIQQTPPESMQRLTDEIQQVDVRPSQLGTPPPTVPPKFTDLLTTNVMESNHKVSNTIKEVSKSKDISLFLANNLKQSLEGVREADSGFGKTTKIDRALDNSLNEAFNLMQNIGSSNDVSFLLKNKSDFELKQIVTDSLQKIMGYNEKEMANLSPKKRAWIDKTVEGIKAGFVNQPEGHPKGQIAKALDELKSSSMQSMSSHGPLSELTRQFTYKTEAQRIEGIKQVLGETRPEIYQAVLQGLESGLPGKITDMDEMGQYSKMVFEGKEYEKIGVVGRGQCGDVLLMENKETGKKYVMKAIYRKEGCENEIEIQIKANQLMGDKSLALNGLLYDKTTDALYLLTELAPKGEYGDNIQSLSRAQNDGLITPKQAEKLQLHLGLESAQILEELQKSGMIHNDIKVENFFRGEDGKLKIADFGEAHITQAGFTEIKGTPGFMSPELSGQGQVSNHKSDQFAYGVMLYRSLFGENPFQTQETGISLREIQNNIDKYGKGDFQLDLSKVQNSELRQLFQDLLSVNPDTRPDFGHVSSVLQKVMGPVDEGQMDKYRTELGKYDKALKTQEKVVENQLMESGINVDVLYRDLEKAKMNIRWYTDPQNANPVKLQEYQEMERSNQEGLDRYNQEKTRLMDEFKQKPEILILAQAVRDAAP